MGPLHAADDVEDACQSPTWEETVDLKVDDMSPIV
jgi:hypothetical protein